MYLNNLIFIVFKNRGRHCFIRYLLLLTYIMSLPLILKILLCIVNLVQTLDSIVMLCQKVNKMIRITNNIILFKLQNQIRCERSNECVAFRFGFCIIFRVYMNRKLGKKKCFNFQLSAISGSQPIWLVQYLRGRYISTYILYSL